MHYDYDNDKKQDTKSVLYAQCCFGTKSYVSLLQKTYNYLKNHYPKFILSNVLVEKERKKRLWLSYGKKVTQCLQSTNVFRQKYLKTSYQKEERVKL